MYFDLQIVTNVVLLRGWYSRLTVCLYGEFAEVKIDNSQAPPPPPPQHMMFGLPQPQNQMPSLPLAMTSGMEQERNRREHGSSIPEVMKPGYGVQSNERGFPPNVKEKGLPADVDKLPDDGRERSRKDTDGRDRAKDQAGDRRDKGDSNQSRQKDGDTRGKGSDRGKKSPNVNRSSGVKSVGESTEAKDSIKDGRDGQQV